MKAGLSLAAALLAGCVQLTWSRDSRFAPIAPALLEELEPGRSELAECLDLFGAPLWVWEHAGADGASAVLAYGWFEGRGLGLRLSVPVSEYYSASLDYERSGERLKGLALFFDEGWRLTGWRTGLLRDLTREAGRPPAFLEDGS